MKGLHQRFAHCGMAAAGHQRRRLAARNLLRKAGAAEHASYQIRSYLRTHLVRQQPKRTRIGRRHRLEALAQPGHRLPAALDVLQHPAQAGHGRRHDDQVGTGCVQLDGRRADGSYGVLWLTPAAEEMTEEDWNFPEGRFLAYVLGPTGDGQQPIFIVLNAAPEEIAFKLPGMPEYKSWQQLLNTADVKQEVMDFASASEIKASPRSVLAFAGSA